MMAPRLVTSQKRLRTARRFDACRRLTFPFRGGLIVDGHEWIMAGTPCARCCSGGPSKRA